VITRSHRVRIFVASDPVDFRKGHDGLAALVQSTLRQKPFDGSVYVFRAKRADRLKLIYWDGSGLVMAYKRLEDSSFTWPAIKNGMMRLEPARFWALARDDRPWGGDDPPGVAFTYAPGRSGQHADTILKGFSGILQVDGYAGYNRLLKRPTQDVTLAYCWAHARRKLHEVTQSSAAPIAQDGLAHIQALYRIEKDLRGLPEDQRHAACNDMDRSIPSLSSTPSTFDLSKAAPVSQANRQPGRP